MTKPKKSKVYRGRLTSDGKRQEIADIFATKVTLDTLSPRVYKMKITWCDTTWGVDEIIAVRQGQPSTWWTPENDKLLSGTLRDSNPTGTDAYIS